MEIRHIDALIHPDFRTALGLFEETRDKEVRKQWDHRVEVLSSISGILLYHPLKAHLWEYHIDEARVKEAERREKYKKLLGERFFIQKPFWHYSKEELNSLFSQRGFSYNPRSTNLRVYGELYDACVAGWFREYKIELGIPAASAIRDANLSIGTTYPLLATADLYSSNPSPLALPAGRF